MFAYDETTDDVQFERIRNRAPRFTYARHRDGQGQGWHGMHRRHRTRWHAPAAGRLLREQR